MVFNLSQFGRSSKYRQPLEEIARSQQVELELLITKTCPNLA
jgi:hypothetical protein